MRGGARGGGDARGLTCSARSSRRGGARDVAQELEELARLAVGGDGEAALEVVAAYPPDRHHLAGMTRRMRQRPSDARRAT